MRYIIAITIAIVLIVAVSIYANTTAKALQKRIHQRLVDAQAAGDIPPDVDLNRGDFTDLATELPSSELLQINLLDSWYNFRIILIPAAIICSLMIAWILPTKK